VVDSDHGIDGALASSECKAGDGRDGLECFCGAKEPFEFQVRRYLLQNLKPRMPSQVEGVNGNAYRPLEPSRERARAIRDVERLGVDHGRSDVEPSIRSKYPATAHPHVA